MQGCNKEKYKRLDPELAVVNADSYAYFALQTTPATVFCEIPGQTPGTYHDVTLNVYDRNSSSDFSCSVQIVHVDGSGRHTPITINSSGGGPGTGLQSIGPVTFPSGIDAFFPVVVVCSIPPAQSGAFSHLASIQITQF